MVAWIVAILLKAAVVLGVAKLVPGVRVKSYGSAIGVALVYGLLSFFLGWILKALSFPLIILTFGLFALVINGLLLWLTDKMLDSFDIRGGKALAVATVLMTVGFVIVEFVVRQLFAH
jgi:putative membrane protein